jgi:hypothetical protein
VRPVAWLLIAVLHAARPAEADVQEGGVVLIPAPRVETMVIQHPQGALTLRGWDRPEIHISFHKRAPTLAMLSRLRVQFDLRDGRVQIRSGVETRGELRGLPQPNAGIDLTIDAPRTAQLSATTFSGELAASGFRGGLDLGTASGAIRVSDVRGPLRTHAAQGAQWLRSIQGDVDATGLDGDLELAAVEGATLSAQVVHGQITARDVRSRLVSLHTSLGTLLLLGGLVPGGRYELHVDEGDIQVMLPRQELRLLMEARGVERRPGYLRADLGQGGPSLRLTAGGQVTLAPLR